MFLHARFPTSHTVLGPPTRYSNLSKFHHAPDCFLTSGSVTDQRRQIYIIFPNITRLDLVITLQCCFHVIIFNAHLRMLQLARQLEVGFREHHPFNNWAASCSQYESESYNMSSSTRMFCWKLGWMITNWLLTHLILLDHFAIDNHPKRPAWPSGFLSFLSGLTLRDLGT